MAPIAQRVPKIHSGNKNTQCAEKGGARAPVVLDGGACDADPLDDVGGQDGHFRYLIMERKPQKLA